MRLFFDQIAGVTNRYSITDSHWFPVSEEWSAVAVQATVSVSRYDHETVTLKGEIAGRCRVVCDRCCETFEVELQSEFDYLVTTRAEPPQELAEKECSYEETVTLYLAEPVIEVDEILREQALLTVPQKKLCREDCKGICAGCGAVLGRESCRCQPEKSESPFTVLKKLKKR